MHPLTKLFIVTALLANKPRKASLPEMEALYTRPEDSFLIKAHPCKGEKEHSAKQGLLQFTPS